MNLSKLFETQRVLDDRIYNRFPGLKEEPWDWKILALQTELGECANEWRGFKKWSDDQKPRTSEIIECECCIGTGDANAQANMEMMMEGQDGHPYEACEDCNETGISGYKNPLLEEYVDGLHLILSIGLELELDCRSKSLIKVIKDEDKPENLILMFSEVSTHINDFFWTCYHEYGPEEEEMAYKSIFNNFIALGEMLGFTWEQVEDAYFAKNKINHERQATGY